MKKRVFILGAGFSHYLSNGAFPITKNLSDSLMINCSDDLRAVLKEHENIEIALSIFELRNQNSTDNQSIKHELSQKLRNILDSKKCKNPRTELPNQLFKKNDVIVSFNYDTLLEESIMGDKWCLDGGYGETIRSNMMNINNRAHQNIVILKPHGSLNFKNNQSIFIGDHIIPVFNEHISRNGLYIMEPIRVPENLRTGESKNKTLNDSDILTLPSYVKSFDHKKEFPMIWHEAFGHTSQATEIIIIGYSFPNEDIMTKVLISHIGSPFTRYQENEENKKAVAFRLVNVESVNSEIRTTLGQVLNTFQIEPTYHLYNIDTSDSAQIDETYNQLIEDLSETI